MEFRILGFNISTAPNKSANTGQTFVPPSNEDGALTISSAAAYGTYLDLDGTAKNEIELITRYREMAMQPELESAIDDVINEAIVQDDDGKSIEIVMDDLKEKTASSGVKKKIAEEFDNILKLLNYKNMAQEIFRRWYVDGRLFYHVIVDKDHIENGIQELRYIDPRKIRKIREITKTKEGATGAEIVTVANEYYVYNDKVQSTTATSGSNNLPGIKITKDSILNVNSGLMDARRSSVLSYLHKAIKPLNQLRMVEDATVIYRISRAPERRIFKIDVGNLPKLKAEQFLNDIMTKYKNKLVYDSATGQVTNDRRNLSMLEDFWIPVREGSKSTEISTLGGAENLGVMEDVIYFEKKLYKSLGVPVARLDPGDAFSLGRTTEITRDELKFGKFIERLRAKFAELFDQAMRVQLTLKRVCTPEEWDIFKEDILFNFIKDNYFVELKEAEIMKERLGLVTLIDPYTGRYYSEDWIRRNVLRLTDDEIKEMKKEIDKENKEKDGEEGAPGQGGLDPDQLAANAEAGQLIDPEDEGINQQIKDFKQ